MHRICIPIILHFIGLPLINISHQWLRPVRDSLWIVRRYSIKVCQREKTQDKVHLPFLQHNQRCLLWDLIIIHKLYTLRVKLSRISYGYWVITTLPTDNSVQCLIIYFVVYGRTTREKQQKWSGCLCKSTQDIYPLFKQECLIEIWGQDSCG